MIFGARIGDSTALAWASGGPLSASLANVALVSAFTALSIELAFE
jgi:hypothetical protein